MDVPTSDFVHVGSLAELKDKGRLVAHGRHSPVLVLYDGGHVFALDNRCPHMGFPLDRGSVEDGILTCHWHHACFDLASGCTFDLWADDVPTCPVEVRDGEIWINPSFAHGDPSHHWCQRLNDGLAHNLGLVIAKAVRGSSSPACPRAKSCGRPRCSQCATAMAGEWGDNPHRARQSPPSAASRGDLSGPVPRCPADRRGLRRCGAAPGACTAREPARSRYPPAVAAALERCAPSRSRRTHSAHCHHHWCPTGRACRLAGFDSDGPRACKRRTRARLHQQGL